MQELRVDIIENIESVSKEEWNALTDPNDPFTDWEFLRCLERSKSVGEEAGWSPCHVLVRKGDQLIGAMPLYAKDHSYGEYIFDWSWANASHRSGIPYYPKLVCAVPFTPATSTRILVHSETEPEPVLQALEAGWKRVAQDLGAMSLHVLFTPQTQLKQLEESWSLMPRTTFQFHWVNQNWMDFEDYLTAFRAPSRKQIRKERKRAVECGWEIVVKTGDELSEEEWASLYPLYRATTRIKGAIPYLSETFFSEIRQHFASHLIVCMALDETTPMAGSISFQKGDHLYGRYWGCLDHAEFLHFELCYYRLIEWALKKGLKRFEAGAQGAHKLKRGFLPTETYSGHWLRHPGLSRAIENYLVEESLGVREEIRYFEAKTPFKRGT